MSAPRLQPSRISHSVQSHKHTAEARGVMANLVHQMEQGPSPATPFTRAGEPGVLVQSDSTLTKTSPLVELVLSQNGFGYGTCPHRPIMPALAETKH